MTHPARVPATYEACRAAFRRAAERAGLPFESHRISACGPRGEALTIDAASLGAAAPGRALVVLSGVHGVEGFIGSAVQCDLLGRLARSSLPADVAVLVVHGVNPWGMAWCRRQNESNVDMNRNWRRDEVAPAHNDAYDLLHALVCPSGPQPPEVDRILAAALDLVAVHGIAFVRDGITRGQYRHADGLHFGGDRTEESARIVERVVRERLAGTERLLAIDLHTGHGSRGALTLLSDRPPGSAQDRFLRALAGPGAVEATASNPAATTGTKSGQIANGLADLFGGATCFATSAEIGTVPDEEQLTATVLEHWVHRFGDRTDPAHAEIVRRYRRCFAPDDAAWEESALAKARALLDAAIGAVAGWRG